MNCKIPCSPKIYLQFIMIIQKTALTTLAIAVALVGLTPQVLALEVVKVSERGRNVIYIKGATANQSVTLQGQGGTSPRAILANSCGMIRIAATQAQTLGTSVTVNGTAVSLTTVPTLTSAACNGSTPPQTTVFKDGSLNLYIPGYTANQAVTVLLPTSGSRNATANGCGLARFTEPTTSNWNSNTSFTVGGTSYTFGTMTSQTYPPVCRNVGTTASPTYVKYEPAN
jgi:hypothetical protein